MAYDGSGNFVRVHNWQDDATAGIKILSSRHDEEDNGFATGLSNAICRDGQAPVLADIPWSGKKITNLGNPINGGDAANKTYVDTLTGWTTSKNISGADLNGRLNFTALGGVNGVTWSNADMSWFGKTGTANQSSNRLVLSDSIDGTSVQPGTDLVSIDQTGNVNLSSGVLSYNLSYDGAAWRTPLVGTGLELKLTGNMLQALSNDTATTTVYQTVTPRQFWRVSNGTGSVYLDMLKSASGKFCALRGLSGNNLQRWQIQLGNSTAESGSNTGSDFSIDRYADGGTYISSPLSITRSTGEVYTPSGIHAGKGLQSHGGMSGADSGYWMNFHYPGSNTLYVYVNDTVFSIAMTPCDYRLKDDVKPLASTWEKVKALKPISFTFRDYGQKEDGSVLAPADGREHWGFLAHEVQDELLPTAATADKDGEMMQALDLVPVV